MRTRKNITAWIIIAVSAGTLALFAVLFSNFITPSGLTLPHSDVLKLNHAASTSSKDIADAKVDEDEEVENKQPRTTITSINQGVQVEGKSLCLYFWKLLDNMIIIMFMLLYLSFSYTHMRFLGSISSTKRARGRCSKS